MQSSPSSRSTAMLAAVATALCVLVVPVRGQVPDVGRPDPHAVFEQRCKSCHSEHGADLARQRMTLKDGAVRVLRTGQPVEALLRAHRGVRLTAAEQAGLVELFGQGVRGGVFQHRCASCHDKAVTFARDKLVMKDGALRTRGDDRLVADMLAGHGEATPAEIGALVDMLTWQLATTPR